MSLSQSNYIEIRVNQCVHYSAFRYGHNEYHPYESYINRLNSNEDLDKIREEFIDFLKNYRPENMGEALGIQLKKKYPMWIYPWTNLRFNRINFLLNRLNLYLKYKAISGWHSNSKDIIDIITHFSKEGIPEKNIKKEYGWLHGAYTSIKENGYLPEKYGYPTGQLLINEKGDIACLVLDGNHRVSTLSVLEHKTLKIKYNENENVYLSELERWPLVNKFGYDKDDAKLVFQAYFKGNKNYKIGNRIERFVNSDL